MFSWFQRSSWPARLLCGLLLATLLLFGQSRQASAQYTTGGGSQEGGGRQEPTFHNRGGGKFRGGAIAVGAGIVGLGLATIILPRILNSRGQAAEPDGEPFDQPDDVPPPRITLSPGAPGGGGGQGSNGGPRQPPRPPSGMPPRNETRFVPDEVVVVLRGRFSQAQLDAFLRRYGLTLIDRREFRLIDSTVFRLRLAPGANIRALIARLAGNGRVGSVQPNYVFSLAQSQPASSVPAARPAQQPEMPQYAMEAMKLNEAHALATGRQVPVALIDSGVDVSHPALGGAVAKSFDSLEDPSAPPEPHGTGMAGAIAARGRLRSVAPAAQLLAARAFSATSSKAGAQGTTFHILRAIDWAYEEQARVVNMSFAGPKDPLLIKMLGAASAKGMILIAAAGNAGPKAPPAYPGADPNVIAVTATDQQNKLFSQANRGRYIDVAAPGVDVLVAAPQGKFEFTTGTSVATAHVSGVVALMLEKRPDLTATQIRRILSSSGVPVQGGDNARLTDADAAVKRAAGR